MPSRGGLRSDLQLSLGDAVGYGVMSGIAEVYLPAFALALGMSPVLAGLVATVPLLAGGLIQLLAPRAIERSPSLRRWVVGSMVVQALALVPLIVIALHGGPTTLVVFASASIYWAAGMSASAGWNPWMIRIVPARIRGRFFGRRQAVVQVSMLACLIGAGVALHAVADTRFIVDVYAAMFALGAVARLGSALMIGRQGHHLLHPRQRRMRLRSVAPLLRGTKRGALLGYMIAMIAASAISGTFLTPYLLDVQGLSYTEYGVFTATIVVVKIGSLPALGRLIHRVGVQRVLVVCAIGIVPLPVLWGMSSSFAWLIGIQVFAGVAWGGFELGMLMALFDAGDDAERTTLQVAFSAMQAIGTAAAALLGGFILSTLGSDRSAYSWLFAASSFARLAAVVLLVRELPRVLARLPLDVVMRAWTLAIRPWGGTIVRPIIDGIERLGRGKNGR